VLIDLSLEPDAVQCIKALRETPEYGEIPIIAMANSVIEADVSSQIANDIQSIYYRNDLNLQDFLEELHVCAAI
jgi:CheY-like chemotaxis protein